MTNTLMRFIFVVLAASTIIMTLGVPITKAEPATKYEQVKAPTAIVISMSAKRRAHHRWHSVRRGKKCDGFQLCRCGTTAARYHGLPYDYNGWNLKEAREWLRFPHTSFRIGVAGVKPHHVLTIVGGSSCASATVYDDAGTYQRNVCGMTFVAVNGNTEQSAHMVQR